MMCHINELPLFRKVRELVVYKNKKIKLLILKKPMAVNLLLHP